MSDQPGSVPSNSIGLLSPEHRRWRWKVLIATYLSYVGYYFCRKAYGSLKAPIENDLGWDTLQLAHIWTAFLAAYMIGQFINGALGRKTGSRVLLLCGMAITLVSNIVFGFTQSYQAFLGFMIVNGLAQASGWPGNVGAVAPWIRSQERGTIMGMWSTCYVLGNLGCKWVIALILRVLAAGLMGYAAWRISFWACSLVMLGIWALFLAWQRNRPEDVGLTPLVGDENELETKAEQDAAGRRDGWTMFFKVLFTPTVLMMGFIYFFLKFLRYALDSWTPYLLHQSLGVDEATAAFYGSVFDIAGIVPMILTGVLLDRVFKGNWRILCFIMCLGMTGAFAFAAAFGSHGPAYLVTAYGLVGFMIYGPDSLIVGTAVIGVGGKREAITAVGIINGLGSIGPIFQEEIIGYLFNRYRDLNQINMLFLLLAGVATLLLFILWLRARMRASAVAT
ncbi:MAG: MFS transporter [Phycisphaerae bacterium]|nr:MFS transporter [Phycisphaerae bacterium]